MATSFEPRNKTTKAAREVAANLTYNDDTPQAQAKHLLLEMASQIDAKDIRVSVKKDGIFITDGLGRNRFGTFKESMLYRIFGVIPSKV